MAPSLFYLAVLALCLFHHAAPEKSHSELYNKLRQLFQNKRVMEIADEVKRDLAKENIERESEDGLLSQLGRLLRTSDKEEREEDEEEEDLVEEERFAENDDKTLLKRLLVTLRRFDWDTQPWYGKKPEKENYDTACYLLKVEERYKKLFPWECDYYLRPGNTNAHTRPCKDFCQDWIKRIRINDDCKFDNIVSEEYCTDHHSCSACRNRKSKLYSKCCGTCERKASTCFK